MQLTSFWLHYDNIILLGLPGNLVFAHDPIYMGNLITTSATLESLLRKEETSAFCIIFGADIAIKKLSSYIVN